MPHTWRLIDSGFVGSAESAAIDEALLEAHISGQVPPTLHFYRRRVPTVSLGYFQKAEAAVDLGACARLGVSVVRRRSGGRSIFTDPAQLIYALVVPENDLPLGREASFAFVCSALASALGTFGMDAMHRPVNDVEVDGRKVSGSAQFRRKGSVLQHGTVLVDADLAMMDRVLRADPSETPPLPRPSERVTTMASVLGAVPDMESVKASITVELAKAFDANFYFGRLTDDEERSVQALVSRFYGRGEWNLRR
jgi:lipoate-protein ligase A